MPICPDCGIDVQKEGLCQECRTSKKKRNTNLHKHRTDIYSINKTNLFFKIGFSILFLISGFFVGWVLFAKPFNAILNPLNIETATNIQTKTIENDAINQDDPSNRLQPESKSNLTEQNNILSNLVEDPGYSILDRKDHIAITSKNDYISWMTIHTKEKSEYLAKRWNCAQTLLTWSISKSITQDRVFEAFLRTPREYFCREKNLSRVYDFTYLDIGWGQTISGPEIVARMTNALNPQPEHKTLEIGTGSGYQSAFLAELSNNVYTIEIIEALAKVTDEIYKTLVTDYPEYKNVHRKIADGYYGWEEKAPFDRIIVTCGIDHIPPPLLKQLAPEGVMVIPVGPPSGQTILKITKHIDEKGDITLEREDIYRGTGLSGDRFVPFKASDGSSHSTVRDMNE
jgi:protein-L-isoaspartate(D-aspartate) O-methyltransferase